MRSWLWAGPQTRSCVEAERPPQAQPQPRPQPQAQRRWWRPVWPELRRCVRGRGRRQSDPRTYTAQHRREKRKVSACSQQISCMSAHTYLGMMGLATTILRLAAAVVVNAGRAVWALSPECLHSRHTKPLAAANATSKVPPLWWA